MTRCAFAGLIGLGLLPVLVICARPSPVRAGLYGDDGKKDVTTGDIDSQDYWWTKWDMMMLDFALKQHQPEGKIGLELASTLKRLDDLAKQYPKHEEIQKWKKHAEEVNEK